jgi:hypothetical protein
MSDATLVTLAVLQAAAPVTALVGTRISPLIRTQDSTLPAITMLRVAVLPQNNLLSNGNLDQTRMQIDSWGATSADVRSVSNAVRSAMEAAGILMMNELPEQFEEDPMPGVFRIIQEFTVWS